MGFYFGAEGKAETADMSPTLTAGEYVSILSHSIETLYVGSHRRYWSCDLAGSDLLIGRADQVVESFSKLVRQDPSDPVARRMLGVALLYQGNIAFAIKQFETARQLLKREARKDPSFSHAVLIQLEAALLRLLLIPMYSAFGRRDAAMRLAKEAFML